MEGHGDHGARCVRRVKTDVVRHVRVARVRRRPRPRPSSRPRTLAISTRRPRASIDGRDDGSPQRHPGASHPGRQHIEVAHEETRRPDRRRRPGPPPRGRCGRGRVAGPARRSTPAATPPPRRPRRDHRHDRRHPGPDRCRRSWRSASRACSLAQIAERQKVDPQKLVDALVAQWSARIDARLAAGALTADQAKTLKANVAVQAKAMVYQTTMGGMRGAAVGAGPNGTMRGMGGPGWAPAGMAGAGRGGMMRGAGAGNGTCPLATTAPSADPPHRAGGHSRPPALRCAHHEHASWSSTTSPTSARSWGPTSSARATRSATRGRRRGPRVGARRRAGPHRPRRHAPRPLRVRRPARAARRGPAVRRDHADRARRRDRPRRRPRDRRRRLRHQAVRAARARRPRGRRPPARAPVAGGPVVTPAAAPPRRAATSTSRSTSPRARSAAAAADVGLTRAEFDLLLALTDVPA